eukprot:TRINITY_DN9032_c0_g1_i1.p1 TRINITY_DN9032_c0_g1~~TRINITY_DN9032_c0_g1_i1.p1  ORF type:complete len:379 (+),score=77.52 TRINITY_DN9032_c0_g1_i1:35-1138(+)
MEDDGDDDDVPFLSRTRLIESEKKTRCLEINLDRFYQTADLRKKLALYGTVEAIRRDYNKQQIAQILFTDVESASNAKERLDKQTLGTRACHVSYVYDPEKAMAVLNPPEPVFPVRNRPRSRSPDDRCFARPTQPFQKNNGGEINRQKSPMSSRYTPERFQHSQPQLPNHSSYQNQTQNQTPLPPSNRYFPENSPHIPSQTPQYSFPDSSEKNMRREQSNMNNQRTSEKSSLQTRPHFPHHRQNHQNPPQDYNIPAGVKVEKIVRIEKFERIEQVERDEVENVDTVNPDNYDDDVVVEPARKSTGTHRKKPLLRPQTPIMNYFDEPTSAYYELPPMKSLVLSKSRRSHKKPNSQTPVITPLARPLKK